MKNRLLLAAFLLFNLACLSAQNTISIVGNSSCACDGCFFITVNGIQTPYTLLWSNGQVSTVTTNPATVCGFCPGEYSVTVTNNGNPQTSGSATGFIESAQFSHLEIISLDPTPCNSDSVTGGNQDCDKVCAGTTTTYSLSDNSGVGTSAGLSWSVSGASSWTVLDPPYGRKISVTWGNAGSGTIKVLSGGIANCISEAFLCVTILEPPKAVIGSNPPAPLQICKGQVVNFQNLSTGDADFYEWFFSDDQTGSSVVEPQHTFLNAGTHTVTLIARSLCLCSDTTTMTVEVLDAPAPVLDCVATICPGETVTYTASDACAPFNWNVSANGTVLQGGTSVSDSITVQWNSGPNGTISLNAASCSGATCPAAGITHIPIISDDAEIRGEERVCPGSTEVYSIEAFGGTSFTWTLSGGGQIKEGQGSNRISIDWYSSTGNTVYWLSVQYDNCYLGCGGQDSIPVTVLSSFVVNGPVEACEGSDGAFNALLVSTNSPILCNWTLTGPSGSVVWNSTAPSAAPNVPFTAGDGFYRLHATPDVLGETCSDAADWTIRVSPIPAKLSAIKGELNICPGVSYTYEAEGGAAQSNYFWTLQNGSGAPLYFPGKTLNVTWGAAGPRWLSVSQVSADGLTCISDTIQIQVTTLTPPEISGTPSVCEYDKGGYTIAALPVVDIEWQVDPPGAGSVSSGQGTTAVQIYWSQAGTHNVNLNVCGATSVFPVTVLANPVPVVQAPAGLCPGSTGLVQTSAPFTDYSWKDADGTVISTLATPELGGGNFIVEVTDANGCRGKQEFFIEEWSAPEVSLTTGAPAGFCDNTTFVDLIALTTASGDYTFQWFRDGVIIPGQTTTTLTTNLFGDYTLLVTNGHGCTNVAGPLRLFQYCGGGGQCTGQNCPGQLCPPNTIGMAIDPTARCDSFHLRLLDPNGVYVGGSANWTIGISGGIELGTANIENPSFTFDNAGQYVAILSVQLTDGTVCHVFDFFAVEVVARFSSLPDCPGETTGFTDLSEFVPTSGISNWSWNFGDPASGANNTSTVRNPDHVYDPSGDYPVTLTVTANSGCISSKTKTTVVPVLPDITFAHPSFTCAGNALEFQPSSGTSGIEGLSWDFGDPASGASNSAKGTPAYHNFSPAGTYTVTATASNVYGCTSSYSLPVVVEPNGLSGTIIPAVPPAICEGGSITLTAPAGGVSYIWSDKNATTTSTLTVSEVGSYRVTVTDANGCTFAPPAVQIQVNVAPDALIKALIVNDLNQVVGTAYPSITVCAGEDVVLKAFTNGSYNYSWSVGTANSPFLYFTDDRNSLLNVGNYTYTVTITNPATGCTAVSDPFDVTVNPVPSGFSITGSNACAGSPNTLSYTGPQPANWQLIWNTGSAGPSLVTTAPGAYQIRVINEFGCEARSNVWDVLPGPPAKAIPGGCHTRCNPDTLCIPNLPGVTNWQWYQNGSPIPGATTGGFIAEQSGTYWAVLTDVFGCTAQSDPLTLNLYTGFGNIIGQVWSDVNDNGVIDAGDTLVSGIDISLYQNGTLSNTSQSAANGNFAFPNILSTDYSVEIDPTTLSPSWQIVIGQEAISLLGCDVQDRADLLLHFQCIAGSSSLQLNTCPGTSVNYNGTDIPEGTTQTVNLQNANGCDSIVTVTVAAWPVANGTQALNTCPGGSVNYGGIDIPVGTTQDVTLQSSHGCDSIVTVTVSAWPAAGGTQTLNTCPGGSVNYGGIDIPVGTTQDVTLQSSHGCDSIVTVTVAAWPVSSGVENLYACAGETVSYSGTNIPVGNTQTFTMQNWLGCDSVVTVNAIAWPNTPGSGTLVFACSGGFYNYNGTNIPAGTSQAFTFDNWHGCDSVVTVSVIALPPTTGSAMLFACPGGSAMYDGTAIPVGTSQTFAKQSWIGCDSIVTVSVAAWPTSTGAETLYTCPGTTASYSGTEIPVGSTQTFTKQNWLGCDSIVTVSVAEWPTSTGAETLYACPGGSATYAGTQVPEGSTQTFTKQNWHGCDSVVTVNVLPWTTTNSAFETSVCPGETFTYQNTSLNGGSVQAFVLQNWLGCDSTVTVTVKQLNSSTNVLEVSVCPGKTYDYAGQSIAGGGSHDFHLSNSEGCDSTLTIMVNEFPSASFSVQTQRACLSAPTGSLEATMNPGGTAPFRFSLDGLDYQDETFFDNLDADEYEVYVEDSNSCVFKQNAIITAVPALNVLLTNGVMDCDSGRVTLTPVISGGDAASMSYQWSNGLTTSSALITEAGPVWVEATDICGTERSEASVQWADLPQDLNIVYVPNVMKPSSSDPENSRFRPIFAAGINLIGFKFMVFDRWGNELFETKSTSDSWDGVFQGTEMNPGVQAWYLEADVSICGRVLHVVKKGDVTVVR